MEKICKICKRTYSSMLDFLRDTSRWRLCASDILWFNCDCGSTLIIQKNEVPWYSDESHSKDPSTTHINFNSLANQIPYHVSSIRSMKQLLSSSADQRDFSKLIATIKQEPFILKEVFKVYTKLRTAQDLPKIQDKDLLISESVHGIGIEQLSNIVENAFLSNFKLKTSAFDPHIFWQQSVINAKITECLWHQLISEHHKDMAYIAGLVCNIGKLVSAVIFPKETDHIWTTYHSKANKESWSQLEHAHSIPDHSILGEIGASFWGLPEYTLDAMRFHHQPPDVECNNETLIHVVCLANMLSHKMRNSSLFNDEQFDKECAYFNLDSEKIDQIFVDLQKELLL